jgi:hypothetical protein
VPVLSHVTFAAVQEHVLRQLASSELPALQEVHARLLRLYADVDIAHMPSDMIQERTQPAVSSAAPHAVDGSGGAGADCDQFVANAAVAGDTFAWHIDADPAGAIERSADCMCAIHHATL